MKEYIVLKLSSVKGQGYNKANALKLCDELERKYNTNYIVAVGGSMLSKKDIIIMYLIIAFLFFIMGFTIGIII